MSYPTDLPQPSQEEPLFSSDTPTPSRPVLVSACLLGLATRYDGRSKTNARVLDYLRSRNLLPIPVCAEETLRIARLTGCRTAILKERSPSCGVHRIHRREGLTAGSGVAASLLRRAGLNLISDEDL